MSSSSPSSIHPSPDRLRSRGFTKKETKSYVRRRDAPDSPFYIQRGVKPQRQAVSTSGFLFQERFTGQRDGGSIRAEPMVNRERPWRCNDRIEDTGWRDRRDAVWPRREAGRTGRSGKRSARLAESANHA